MITGRLYRIFVYTNIPSAAMTASVLSKTTMIGPFGALGLGGASAAGSSGFFSSSAMLFYCNQIS